MSDDLGAGIAKSLLKGCLGIMVISAVIATIFIYILDKYIL